jgi:hypothetical protein
MGFNTSQQAYSQAVGTAPTNGIWIDVRNPTTADVGNPWPLGQFWLNNTTSNLYYLNNYTTTSGYVQANWVLISVATGIIDSLSDTANTPVYPSSSTDSPPRNIQLINLDGSLSIVSDAVNDRLILSTNNSGTFWAVTTSSQTLAENAGWFANGGGNLNFALPAIASVGDTYEIVAMSTGGWTITQAAGQSISIGPLTSTVGVGGSVNSLAKGDWIKLVCNVANTSWLGTVQQGDVIIT